jgi:hypothetical protein
MCHQLQDKPMKCHIGFSAILFALLAVVASPMLKSQGGGFAWSARYSDHLGRGGFSDAAAVTGVFNPRPVELDCFTADRLGGVILLNWKTVTGNNTIGFHVQKAIGAIPEEWSDIGLVEENGTANSPRKYRFVDDVVTNGIAWYRLKRVDRDGSMACSDAVAVDPRVSAADMRLSMYPNPARGASVVSFVLPAPAFVTATVINALGSVVATLCADRLLDSGTRFLPFDASALQGGMYFLYIRTTRGSSSRPIFVVNPTLRARTPRPILAAD